MSAAHDAAMEGPEGTSRGMDRRVFLSAATLAAVGAALSACGGGDGDGGGGGTTAPIPPGTGLTLTVTPGNFAALGTVGGIATVGQLNGTSIAVVRTGASTYSALSQRCTHQGCIVAIVPNGFSCEPARTDGCGHGSLFSASGQVTRGPANRSLQTLNVTVNPGGTLTITP